LARHLSALESRGLKWVTETFPYCRDTAELPKGVGVATLAKLDTSIYRPTRGAGPRRRAR
jgi:hypothetical protein